MSSSFWQRLSLRVLGNAAKAVDPDGKDPTLLRRSRESLLELLLQLIFRLHNSWLWEESQRVFETFLRPSAAVAFEKWNNVRLLLQLLLLAISGSLLAVLYLVVVQDLALPYALLNVLGLLLIYLLARGPHYLLASWAFAALPYSLLSLAFLLSSIEDAALLLYSLLGFFLASLLLRPRAYAVFCLLASIWYLVVFLTDQQILSQAQSMLLFGLALAALVLLASLLRYAQLQQIDSQLHMLEEVLEVSRDATADAEEARQQAVQADTMKSAFLASMSHELRTPLNAIINFSKLLRAEQWGGINLEQGIYLDRVVSNGEHLLNLINDVLDISKIAAGSLSLYLEEEVDLCEEFSDLEAMVLVLLGQKTVQFKMDLQPVPLIMADRGKIQQIVVNLLSNACKFTHEGQINLSLDYLPGEGKLRFIVQDTGVGIAEAEQEKVFRAFEQSASGLRLGTGTGLGMPISRALAEAHGGSLHLYSLPGKGTRFSCLLPLCPPEDVVEKFFVSMES